MKIEKMILLLLTLTLIIACNAEKQAVQADVTEAQVNSFPQTNSRPSDMVVCHNCQATFKMSSARQKTTHGHSYIECPICHHDYLKKAQ